MRNNTSIYIKLAIVLFLVTETLQTDLTIMDKTCKTDMDCSPPYMICSKNLVCKHKNLFPVKLKEIFGALVIISLGVFTAAAGIGGGTIFVPMALMLFDFNPKQAVALSNGLILLLSGAKFFAAFKINHPKIEHKTIIDYNVVLILMASSILGSFIGSVIAPSIPDLIQLILLISIMSLSLYQTIPKTIKIFASETLEIDKQKKLALETSGETQHALVELKTALDTKKEEMGEQYALQKDENKDINQGEVKKLSAKIQHEIKEVELTAENINLQKEIKRLEGTNFNPKKMIIVINCVVASILLILLRGGKGMDSIIGTKRCGFFDWFLMLLFVIILGALSYMSVRIIKSEQMLKDKSGWVIDKFEVRMENDFLKKGILMGLVVGITSAITGVGGGMLMNPFMISFGVLPQVASFTSLYLTLWGKLTSVLIETVADITPKDYTLLIGVFLVTAVVNGEIYIARLVKKMGRQSIVSIIFIGILIFSLLLIVFIGIKNVQTSIQNGKGLLVFKSFC